MMKIRLIISCVRVLGAVAAFVSLAGCAISQPTFRKNSKSDLSVNPESLKRHVEVLSQDCHPRDWENVNNLDKCAEYIATHFTNAGATTTSQVFTVRGRQYQNVIGRFGVGKGPKVIIGAHYDSCADTPGADDNASGVSALIELAYLLGRAELSNEVELVGYTLEEPPFFGTQQMGSAIHAESIASDKSNVLGVIVLEVVGYFSDEKGSQSYPSRLLKIRYPSTGNFISVVGTWDQRSWIKKIKIGMKGSTDLPVYSMRAPAFLPGIDFSDHRNYWPHDIKAVMVTDTAFYRNKQYHTLQDTADRLDYVRMSQVVVSVFEAIGSL